MTEPMFECARCSSPLEDGDLRCCVCALPVAAERASVASPPTGGRAALPEGVRRSIDKARVSILRCHHCGAAVVFAATSQTLRCGFCGWNGTIEEPVDPIEEAQRLVPFEVDEAEAAAMIRAWLAKRGYFAPTALALEAEFEKLTPLYWAGWVVNARAHVAWTADSDEGSGRSAWAPHAGQLVMTFDDIVVPASRGMSRADCRRLVPYYELSKAVPVDVRQRGMIESFDAQRSAARRQVHHAIESIAKTRVERYVPGRKFRNVHAACLVEGQTTTRMALPAWVLAYTYRGSAHRAVVHGQRAEIVFGTSPIDWSKVARVVSFALTAIAAIAILIMLLSGCGGGTSGHIDAPDFGQQCTPSGPFSPLTGRSAVQGLLNVHVDAGGLIKVDTTSELLLTLDLVQTGTSIAVSAQVCSIHIPDVPLAGQDMPIQFSIPQPTLDSVGVVMASATLSSADQSCADFTTAPITLVLGARLDPSTMSTAPLPTADDTGVFTACQPNATTSCTAATGTDCACDQESDGNPGATLVAHNVPGIMLDQVYTTLRTTFSLTGQVFTSDLVKGEVTAALDTGPLACKLTDGSACTPQSVNLVKTLNPVVTPQPTNPSTFQAVRVPGTTTCADVIAQEATLFPP